MCATVENEAEKEAEAWAQSGELSVLELTGEEVLQVAKAAANIRSLEELRRQELEIQGKRICVRRAVKTLEEICCNPRLIVALMLYAADHPDWAWVNFWAAFCPEMSVKEMSRIRKIRKSDVYYWLSRAELPRDAYEFIPENR